MKRLLPLFFLSIIMACQDNKPTHADSKENEKLLQEHHTKQEVKKDSIVATTPDEPITGSCAIMREGTFKYVDIDGDDVIVKIKDDVSTEEHKKGKYIIMSKIKWISDCEYENMLVMSTLPNFNLKPGTVMNITIDKVDGLHISFTATAKSKSYRGTITKLE
jgi:hypothetical protein